MAVFSPAELKSLPPVSGEFDPSGENHDVKKHGVDRNKLMNIDA